MQITVLIENTAQDPLLCAQHGLSLYLETKEKKILFDFGQTEAFADNAEKLGVDLSQVDLAVLSHGHYDHSGGIKRFFELNDHAPLYVSRYAFGQHLNAEGKFIGVDTSQLDLSRIVWVDDLLKLTDSLTLFSCNDRSPAFAPEPFGLQMVQEGKAAPDDFRHEQYLQICEDGRRVLVSGCSHKGILNIAGWTRPDVLIGGFHFMKLDVGADAPYLDRAAQELLAYPTQYFTGHCTGAAQFDYLKSRMGDRLLPIYTGQRFTV